MSLSSSFQRYPGSKKSLKDMQCCVCLNGFETKQVTVSHEKSLHHVFHQNCLEMWVKQKSECPICRQKITHINDLCLDPNLKFNKWSERIKILSTIMVFASCSGVVCLYLSIGIVVFKENFTDGFCDLSRPSSECFFYAFKQTFLILNSIIVAAKSAQIIYKKIHR